ncbi:CapA family protein [Vreelandella zhaodongensis]|uniref:CapA family protein n=1 Tax=Vreelandella zhaodongensis TaxID=1176240 RepID=A0ABX2SM74_VREZH|nr:CapA family protein [Halomonas zhaodongensis]NYS43402.1 CapA family protein [Halomonas zhaodongensis]
MICKVGAVGDILLHGNVIRSCKSGDDYDFSAKMGLAEALFKNFDISIVNQESIAAGSNYPISSYPKFNSPTQILDYLVYMGVDIVNVANNHMLDFGQDALSSYISNLKQRNLEYVGCEVDDSTTYKVIESNGIKVAFISYTDGSKLPIKTINELNINYFKGESYAMRMNHRLTKIKRDIKEAKAHADAVILSLHFGEEYHRLPNSFQREVVITLAETSVDVIIGHHPHVLQPTEWIENSMGKQVLVAYSLGNFFSGQGGLYRQIGGCFSFDLRKVDNECVVENESIEFTYVDVFGDLSLKKLSDLADQNEILRTGRGRVHNAKSIHDKLKSNFTKFNSSITVY